MAHFMLMIEASVNTAGGSAPVLDIYVDGAYVTSSSAITAVTGVGSDLLVFTLDFDDSVNGYPSSLSFQFSGSSGDPADSVTIESVRINGQALNTGSDLTATILAQGQTASVSSTLSHDYLFGRVEPSPGDLGTPTQTGTAGADEINGTNGADVIDGGAGDDRLRGIGADDAINGGDGNDTIFGENGNDIIIGGLGDDILYGNDGDDLLYGQDGNDRLSGGAGNDVLNGGAGNDSLTGDAGDDILYGEDGNDRLIGVSGNNIMYGDAGNDVLIGGTDDDLMYGGADNDQMNGGKGDDTLYGEAGDDFLTGGLGNDTISGGDGNDTIDGGASSDTIDGGAGTDTLIYTKATGGINVNLATGIVSNDGEGGVDTVSSVENIMGTASNDVISGSSADNILNGGNGNDTVSGVGGNNSLYGGSGNDALYAGDGDVTIISPAAATEIQIDLSGVSYDNKQAATLTLSVSFNGGDTYQDFIFSFSEGANQNPTRNNMISAVNNGADDRFSAGSGSGSQFTITIDPGDGWYAPLVSRAWYESANDDQSVFGAILTQGTDAVIDITGSNILSGGEGNDALYGGSGLDIFVFSHTGAANADTVHDFNVLYDKIDVRDLLAAYDPVTDAVTDFILITESGGNSELRVDSSGAGSFGAATVVATFTGVTGLTDEVALESSGTLITA